MSKWNQLFVALAVVGAPFSASAQTAAEHEQHHPAGTAPQAASQATPPAGAAVPSGMAMMSGMDRHMKAMQEMRAKMMADKTPAERQALMAEQMKLMREGTGMMQAFMDRMAPPAGN